MKTLAILEKDFKEKFEYIGGLNSFKQTFYLDEVVSVYCKDGFCHEIFYVNDVRINKQGTIYTFKKHLRAFSQDMNEIPR